MKPRQTHRFNIAKKKRGLINHNIRAKEVRLILESSQEIINLQEAINMAQQRDMDLVCVSTKTDPPICKIMDYGKYLYEEKKKQKKADKKQRQAIIDTKEIQFRPATGVGDILVKTKKIQETIDDGDKVKLIMKLRGRENAMRDFCMGKFKEFLEYVKNYEFEYRPTIQGNKILAILKKSAIIKKQ